LAIIAVASVLAIAARGQGASKGEFYAGSQPLSRYVPGVDYAPGEVVFTIPTKVEPSDAAKLVADLQGKLEAAGLDRPIIDVRVVQLAPVKPRDGKALICGQRLVTVRFDPRKRLDEGFLSAIRVALARAYGQVWIDDIEGEFTEAPNDFAGKPSDEPTFAVQPAVSLKRQGAYPHEAKGVLVAVIDSGSSNKVPGVDYAETGWEFHADVSNGPGGFTDNFSYTAQNGSVLLGHGSQAAGIVSGSPTDPGTGLAQGATVMPLQACDANRACSALQIVQALCYAVSFENNQKRPADVINLSLGGFVGGKAIEKAVLDARNANAVVVMSAGNSRNPRWGIPGTVTNAAAALATRIRFLNDPVYPAAFSSGYSGPADGLIAVGSVKSDTTDPAQLALSSFSTFNSHLDFAVRGEALELYWPDGSLHGGHSGTSFAAPFVTGMAAVLRQGTQGAARTPEQIEELLRAPETPGAEIELTCGTTCGALGDKYRFRLKKLHASQF
jgi:subtilisin family serine protease